MSLLSGRDTSLRRTEVSEVTCALSSTRKLARLHLSFLLSIGKNSQSLKYDK